MLEYLNTNYGKVPTEEVKQQEQEIRTMNFHRADPLILLYGPIEKLRALATTAGIEYSEEQLLDIGLTVIRNTRDFERALLEWEARQAVQKTWENFKQHFTSAQQQLKAIRGPTMQQAGYHHANMLASQLQKDLDARSTEMMSMMQEVLANTSGHNKIQSEITPPSISPANHQANAVQNDTVQMEMLRLLQQMQQTMQQLANNQKTNNTSNNTRTTKTKKQAEKTPDNATFFRRVTNKYCWTHGAWNHNSDKCQHKAPGHQYTATFANRMGGSNAFCQPTGG